MNNCESLALLSAGCVKYHPGLSASTNTGKMSKLELAGLLKGLDTAAMLLALAKYLGDQDAERSLVSTVRVWAAGLANSQGWVWIKGKPVICNMSALAVFEVVRPNVCSCCLGNRYTLGRPCVVCDGTGVKRLSERDIAEAIGLSRSVFRSQWKGRYADCLSYVIDIDNAVMKAVRENGK